MKLMSALAAVVVLGCAPLAGALAADPPKPTSPAKGPKTNFIDHSSRALIDEATAKKLMDDNIPARVWKVYPAAQYVFVSQVEGGMTAAGICVVTARTMLMTITPAMKAPLFRPQKTTTAFDAQPGATGEQCKTLARDKLVEATKAIVTSLVKT